MRLASLMVIAGLIVTSSGGIAAADDTYAAIAFSKETGASGWSHRFGTRAGAEEKALQECGPGCSVVLWVRNQCAGLSVGHGRGYGTYMGANERIVGDASLNECLKRTTDCVVKATVCSAE